MSLITSPEFFINMKSYPRKGDRDYDAFVEYELDKMEYGVTINGVYISGWLYWHLNHWQTYIPMEDARSGEVKDVFTNPRLRDNEWVVAENLQKAKEHKKGLLIIGGRRIAKTSIVSSWLSLHATLYQGSQNIIVGNNKGDIRNITLQMEKGLSNVSPFLHYDQLLYDWTKEVELGWKEKKIGGKKLGWSNIYIRNTEDGKNTEVLAGLTPKALVYDEVGKAPTREAFIAGMKAFESPYGWRCSPILTGTGGDFIKGRDAEEMFNHPDRFNLLAFQLPHENKKSGLFIPGNYATTYPKKGMTLAEFLEKEKGSELDDIPIYVTQWELSNQMIDAELERWEKANDQREYLKAKMYAPRTVAECFMSDAGMNPFPVEIGKRHVEFLRTNQQRKLVKLYKDINEKISYIEDSRLRVVTDFPVNKASYKEGCVVIYEDPMPNAPLGLYIAGADPYNINTSDNSPSLGSLYIYKRTYDPVNGTYQRRIVACYVGRPDTMKQWHQNAEMLLELYNATCMIEASGTNFTQYLESKNKGNYLADGYNIAREINPKTSISAKTKGLPATTAVQNHYFNLAVEYCTEDITMSYKDGEIITAPGIIRIPDDMLVTELINWNKDDNFDRLVAFGHILAYEESLMKYMSNIKMPQEQTQQEKPKKKEPHSPFISTNYSSPFTTGSNPFTGIK